MAQGLAVYQYLHADLSWKTWNDQRFVNPHPTFHLSKMGRKIMTNKIRFSKKQYANNKNGNNKEFHFKNQELNPTLN